MKRVTIVLTADNQERLTKLVEQTGLNPNRLLNTLISNALVIDVVRREPVALVEKAALPEPIVDRVTQ